MSDIEQKIPFMFRGSSRVYRVVGVQDSVFFGLNVNIKQGKTAKLELVFACLGNPPEGTPFKPRGEANFIVAFEAKPQGELPVVAGTYLNKIEMVLGNNLTSFQVSDYLHKNIPTIQVWLDKILEDAGIVPAYNDVADIFSTFFGEESPEAAYVPLDLPKLTAETAPPADFDFSKYGKGDKPSDGPNILPGGDDAPGSDEGEDEA